MSAQSKNCAPDHVGDAHACGLAHGRDYQRGGVADGALSLAGAESAAVAERIPIISNSYRRVLSGDQTTDSI